MREREVWSGWALEPTERWESGTGRDGTGREMWCNVDSNVRAAQAAQVRKREQSQERNNLVTSAGSRHSDISPLLLGAGSFLKRES